MGELSREGEWGVGRARQSTWGGEPARHWPPESVAKAGLAGSDGAVIGASESSDWRLGQVSSRGGCACQSLKARMTGVVNPDRKILHGPVRRRGQKDSHPAFLNTTGWRHGALPQKPSVLLLFPKS